MSNFDNECQAVKNILVKFFTFLNDEEACKNAGFTFYKKYSWHYDGDSVKTYILANEKPKKEFLQMNFGRDTRYNDIYDVQGQIQGKRYMPFILEFLKQNAAASDLTSGYMRDRFSGKYDDIFLSHTQIRTIDTKVIKPMNPLKTLNKMKPDVSFINLFPGVHCHGGRNEFNKFTMERIAVAEKFFDAIIAGALNK